MGVFKKRMSMGLACCALFGWAIHFVPAPPVWADTLNLYHGGTVECKVQDVVGDLIRYSEGSADDSSIYRMALSSRLDQVKARRGRVYEGEILYMDQYTVEINTTSGKKKIMRLWVKDITLGLPIPQADMDNESSSLRPVSYK